MTLRGVCFSASAGALLLVLSIACENSTDPCVTRTAVRLEVIDSVTGARLPNTSVKMTTADGFPALDSIVVSTNTAVYPLTIGTAPGTYTLQIAATGYASQTRTVTVAAEGLDDTRGCIVANTVSVTARMLRFP
jgi:hypothetical protein